MDTSERYIKMCEKALKDYCSTWVWKQGDWAYSFYYKQVGVIEETAHYFRTKTLSSPLLSGFIDYDKIIPLPRQDQLQEILRENAIFSNRVLIAVIDKFRDFVFAENHLVFETMEQLWLAFVMKEKYGKVWAGEAWETIKAGVI